MNDKLIEANLERSLRSQVKAPRLAKRFDAAVWARIEASSTRAPARASASSRWMFVVNGVGLGVAFLLLVIFGLQSLSGVEASVTLPTVSVPATTIEEVTKFAGLAITIGSIVFGLMFTPLGRRLRAEFN